MPNPGLRMHIGTGSTPPLSTPPPTSALGQGKVKVKHTVRKRVPGLAPSKRK